MAGPHLVPQPVGGTWDNNLYGIPLFSGYNQRQQSGVQGTEDNWSEPYWRRAASQRPILLTVSVRQTPLQWLQFYNFWSITLVNGHKWFQIQLENAGIADNFTVHLSNFRAAPRPDTIQSFTRIEMDLEALLLDP